MKICKKYCYGILGILLVANLCTVNPVFAAKSIKFGLHQNEPLNFRDKDGEAKGLVIDVFTEIANKEGWEIDYVPCVWQECLDKLKSGEINVLSAIGYTSKRAETYDFNETPLITNWGMLVIAPNTNIQSILDLEGKTIAVMARAGHTAALKKILADFRINVHFQEVDDFLEVFQLVKEGKADAGVVNRLLATQFSSAYNVVKSSIIFNPIEIRYALTKGRHPEVLAAIDRHLLRMRENQDSLYYASLSRWLGGDNSFQLSGWLFFLLVSSLFLILLFVSISFIMRKQVKIKTKALHNKNIALEAESKERKEAEARLSASEKRYSLAQKAANVGTWDWDINTGDLLWSEQIEPMFGFAPGKFKATYKAFLECIHPEDRKYVTDVVDEALASGTDYDVEHRIIWPDKTIRWVAEKGNVFRDEDEKPIRMLGVVLDITEQKESLERLRTVLDSFEGLIYVADMDTYELLFVNKYGQDIWGDITGKICWQTLQSGQTGQCDFCTNDRLTDAESTSTGPYVWEFLNTVNNEWYECRDQAIKWLDGRIVRMEIASNITFRKTSEQQREKLEENLRQVQKMEAIGTLAGGIAHDFNNILSIIINATEMSQIGMPDGSAAKEYNKMVLEASHRAKELVKQILAFSRQSPLNLMPLKLHEVIKDNLKLARSIIPATVEIQQNINNINGFVNADPTQIHQLVMNLCTNAVHAMDEDGTLIISFQEALLGKEDFSHAPAFTPGKYAQISITDSGYGMDKETLARIFDPFFTTKKAGEGTGMGLAVIHGIVEVHSGMIKVESEPDAGTTFHIYFPVVEIEEIQEEEISEQLPQGSEQILFVDDEKMLAEIGGRILDGLGYKVTAISSSKAALETFRSAPEAFDLVITDQSMPYLSGAELAVELLKIKPDIPIILCTGYSKKISEKQAGNIGIRELFFKPYDKRGLSRVIRKALDGSC